MAEEFDDLFAGVETAGTEPKPTTAPKPLGIQERFILQNIYDTQPKRRAAFLKKLGYEMDPKDDNKYRPLGSQGAFVQEIDPGFSAYFKKGFAKEMFQDVTDVAADTVGGAGGTALGGVVGAGIGGVPGAMAGGALGSALGFITQEGGKEIVADFLLDESIPYDLGTAAIQGAVTTTLGGLLPGAAAGGVKLGKKALQTQLGLKLQAATKAIQDSGGKISSQALGKIIENYEKYTPDKVKGGIGAVRELYDNMLAGSKRFASDGERNKFLTEITDIDYIPEDAEFGKLLKPFREKAQLETQKLALDPNASVRAGDLLEPLQAKYLEIQGKIASGTADEAETAALPLIKAQADRIKKAAQASIKAEPKAGGSLMGGNAPVQLDEVKLNYGQAREQLKLFQEGTFVEGAFGTKSENPVMGSLARQFREGLDMKAKGAGSTLPDMNKMQHEILQDYRTAQETLKPQNIYNAYIAPDTVQGQGGDVRAFLGSLDTKYGTKLAESFEDAGARGYMDQVYFGARKPVGSSLALPTMLEGISKGEAVGRAVGEGIPVVGGRALGSVGEKIGGAIGAARAAEKASPEKLLQNAIDVASKYKAAATPVDPGLLAAGSIGATQQAAQAAKFIPSRDLPATEDQEYADLFEGL